MGSRGRGRFISAVIGAALLPAVLASQASAVEWAAQYADECCSYVAGGAGAIEAGQTVPAWFTAKNVGTGTWFRGSGDSGVFLGTTAPTDRGSLFADSTWFSTGRAARLEQEAIKPNETGRFSFVLHAPDGMAAQTVQEHFAVVNEHVSWMGVEGNWYLPVTVLSAAPPEVHFTQAPARVNLGDAADVAAFATDNGAVDHVTLTLERSGVVATAVKSAAPYAASFQTAGLAAGLYTLRAVATDRAGHSATALSSVEIAAPGTQSVDADGDGILDSADRCPTLSRGPSDRNGDGCPGPLERIDARFSIAFAIKRGRLRIVQARLLYLPADTTIRISCRKCGVNETLASTGDGSTLRSKRLRGLRLKPGATIDATITKPGAIGRLIRYVAARHPTVKHPFKVNQKELCIPPGGTPQAVCTG